MNEKRFIYEEEHYNFPIRKRIRNAQNNETYDLRGAYELLNELSDENGQLKEENEQLKKEYKIAIDEMVTDYKKLEKENEQLRKQVKSSETTSDATSNYNAHLESKITTLEKENEQLKKKLESLQKVLHLVECVSDK